MPFQKVFVSSSKRKCFFKKFSSLHQKGNAFSKSFRLFIKEEMPFQKVFVSSSKSKCFFKKFSALHQRGNAFQKCIGVSDIYVKYISVYFYCLIFK